MPQNVLQSFVYNYKDIYLFFCGWLPRLDKRHYIDNTDNTNLKYHTKRQRTNLVPLVLRAILVLLVVLCYLDFLGTQVLLVLRILQVFQLDLGVRLVLEIPGVLELHPRQLLLVLQDHPGVRLVLSLQWPRCFRVDQVLRALQVLRADLVDQCFLCPLQNIKSETVDILQHQDEINEFRLTVLKVYNAKKAELDFWTRKNELL